MTVVELVKNYRPNTKLRSAMAKIKVLATVGPTATGKTTLMKALAADDPNFRLILDETSRKPRAGEKQGVDFLFRGRDEIIEDAKNGDLIQVAIGPNGDLYCTRLEGYPENGTGLLPLVPAAVAEFRKLPFGSFKAAFIVPRTYNQWHGWLTKQAKDSQWSDEQLNSRLQEARKSFEFALSDRHIRFVLNDVTSSAAKRLLQVAHGEPPDDESAAKAAAESNYRNLIRVFDIK